MAEQSPRNEPVELTCGECGADFTHTKRGTLPKRCPACREQGKAKPAPAPGQAEEPPRPRGIVALENNLRVQLSAVALAASLADPWLGQHIAKNIPAAASVHANLAMSNPKIRAAMEKGVEMAGWGPVIVFWLTFAVPVLAHYREVRAAKAPSPAGAGDPRVVNFPGQRAV